MKQVIWQALVSTRQVEWKMGLKISSHQDLSDHVVGESKLFPLYHKKSLKKIKMIPLGEMTLSKCFKVTFQLQNSAKLNLWKSVFGPKKFYVY